MDQMYQKFLRQVEEHRHWGSPEGYLRVQFLALGMAGEAGEAANLAKKGWRGDTELRQELVGEAVDTINYAYMLLAELGVPDPVPLCVEKMDDVERRPAYQQWLLSRPR